MKQQPAFYLFMLGMKRWATTLMMMKEQPPKFHFKQHNHEM